MKLNLFFTVIDVYHKAELIFYSFFICIMKMNLSFTVIDVYQEWCGPCLALVGNFRRLKNELGDPLLNFAIVIIAAVSLFVRSCLWSSACKVLFV